MAIGAPERAGVVPAHGRDGRRPAARRRAAILLGKTNCPPYGGGIETDNEVYGRTSNPYDLARTPGGSSGGEAAIIAAQGSPCGLGTDSGASVRLPAHFCGLAALKPTAHRVPVTGVLDDEGQIGALGDPRTQLGPLARSVADVALLLRVIAGPGRPRRRRRRPCRSATRRRSRSPACGWPSHTEDGARQPTDAGDGRGRWPTPRPRCATPAPRSSRRARPAGGHELTIEVWRSYGGGPSSASCTACCAAGTRSAPRCSPSPSATTLILSPVFPDPARRHGTMNVPGKIDPTSFTTPHSLTGWPAATVRCGTSPEGLPIGVQLVARPWRDDVALAAARRSRRARRLAAAGPLGARAGRP